MNYKQLFADIVAEKTGIPSIEIIDYIEPPKDKSYGDLAIPCFRISKQLNKSPQEIANELSSIPIPNTFSALKAVGPFLNITINPAVKAQKTIEEITKLQDEYGQSTIGHGKTICIEFSSPNIAKPFHVGHLRTTLLGHALRNMYNALGYETIAINYLGDYGTQFGKLIVAFQKWGDQKSLEEKPIQHLLDIYVKFHEEAKIDPSYDNQAREAFAKLSEKNEEYIKLWEEFKVLSLREFNKVYDRLNINFDSDLGEAYFAEHAQAIVKELQAKNLLVESDGAQVVEVGEKNPPCIITKSDGTTIYATRDIGAALFRKRQYDFEESLYIVDVRQALHFQQFFKVIELMGNEWAAQLKHISFGLMKFEEGVMSTREGNVIFMIDFLDKATEKALQVINEKNPKLKFKEETAEMVGLGAVIFSTLFSDRNQDINFSWNAALDFQGETAAYIQYTHARICSILAKADLPNNPQLELLINPAETALIDELELTQQKIIEATKHYKPSTIAKHIISICQRFNEFYAKCPVIQDDKQLQDARLQLLIATKQVIANQMQLLGIKVPNEM